MMTAGIGIAAAQHPLGINLGDNLGSNPGFPAPWTVRDGGRTAGNIDRHDSDRRPASRDEEVEAIITALISAEAVVLGIEDGRRHG